MTSASPPPPAELDVQREIEQFLYHEARLLDERRFTEWLDLMADDIHYWMPTITTRTRRERHLEVAAPDEVAHFDDDKNHLRMRVDRLGTGQAWSEEPNSRTRHLITNVMVDPPDPDGARTVRSNFLLYRRRGESTTTDLFAGAREDRLRPGGSHGWLIAKRTILIDQSLLLAKNLSVFF
ncbi:3-phenylpropionate/cinnamic acid dioxygenase subunit beta [Streptomyces sp. NPDC005373]|uniref:aromatic-ring-hydroxylating dioxygenase subunit beta n=1 Tax=Streptomyces sp. NPDC005373 TaxID=3156879 RepID=UPI00339DD8F8